MAIIVEQISRGKKLISRHKFNTEQVTIGRSYQNDIILSDPHVCPEHISLTRDQDQWRVQDLDSINGSFINDDKQAADQHILHSGDIIKLGKSHIRILFPDHPVAPSLLFSPFDSLIEFFRQPWMIGANVLFFGFVIGFMFYLTQPTDANYYQYIVRGLITTFGFALWPLLISLISHLTKHDARVWSQIGVSFALFNAFWFIDMFQATVSFNVSSNWHAIAPFLALLPIATIFALFWLNNYIGFHFSRVKRFVIASGLTLLVAGGVTLVSYSQKPDFSFNPSYDATLLMPTFRFAQPSTVDKFVQDASKLFANVDKQAEQKD